LMRPVVFGKSAHLVSCVDSEPLHRIVNGRLVVALARIP